MSTVRIALANLRVPTAPEASVLLATAAVAEARRRDASVICFPECFIPGYRWPGTAQPPPDPLFRERAWAEVAGAAKGSHITVILGTERVSDQGLQITTAVITPEGRVAGWQDKVQLDPSEEAIYPAIGTERRVFTAGPLTFGVVICHEGWRYPEIVSREGDAVSRGREHLLRGISELRKRRLRHHVRRRAPRWHASVLSALWPGRFARGRSRPSRGYRIARISAADVSFVGKYDDVSYKDRLEIFVV